MGMFTVNWANRDPYQKVSLVAAIIVVACALIGVIANIAIMDIARKNGAFANDSRVRFLFYTSRIFSMCFCGLCLIAEFYNTERVKKWVKAFRFFLVRGMLCIWSGLLILLSGGYPGEAHEIIAWSLSGWCLTICGFLYICMSCCCFKEYSEESRSQTEKNDDARQQQQQQQQEMASPQQQTAPTAAASTQHQALDVPDAAPPAFKGKI